MLAGAEQTGGNLVRSAAAGDRDAFASLVRLNQSMVYSLAWNSLRDQALAEELAQDVFLELHKALPGLDSPAHVTNWLRRVAMHRCIDHVRRERSRPRVALDDIPEPVAESTGTTDLLMLQKVRSVIGTLPARARAVVVLRYQEDMEPTEIAGVLGLPVNTVKSQLHRALAMLRAKLQRSARIAK